MVLEVQRTTTNYGALHLQYKHPIFSYKYCRGTARMLTSYVLKPYFCAVQRVALQLGLLNGENEASTQVLSLTLPHSNTLSFNVQQAHKIGPHFRLLQRWS